MSFPSSYQSSLLESQLGALEYENYMYRTLFNDVTSLKLADPKSNGTGEQIGIKCRSHTTEEIRNPQSEEAKSDNRTIQASTMEAPNLASFADFKQTPTDRSGQVKKKEEKASVQLNFKATMREMSRLFGEGSNSIYSDEVKMQLRFDELCDDHDPVLWPCLPLKFGF